MSNDHDGVSDDEHQPAVVPSHEAADASATDGVPEVSASAAAEAGASEHVVADSRDRPRTAPPSDSTDRETSDSDAVGGTAAALSTGAVSAGSARAAARRSAARAGVSETKGTATPKRAAATAVKRPNVFARVGRFLREVVAELRKVIWPTRNQMVTYTIVVIAFVVFMVALIGVLDLLFAKAVLAVFG